MIELKLICGVIGFLFIGAILGMVIGLNAPPIEEKNDDNRTDHTTRSE